MAEGRGGAPGHLGDEVIAAQVHAMLFGAASEAAPLPTIGRYRVLRSLGEGGMGSVWLARDDQLDRDVAIKVLRTGLDGDRDLTMRMRDEAKSLARLAHPNVVVVHEVGEDDRGVFIAMEYVDGQTLAAWQAAPGRTAAEILATYCDVGRGLAAAHAMGVVHRDFKPANVLVGNDGRARVVDFGLARTAGRAKGSAVSGPLERLTQAGVVLGTPAYMAPEQLDGRVVDARSDQFSFALALFEALAGQPPFAGDDVASRRRAMTRPVTAWPPTMPRRVRAALGRALAVDPEARWPELSQLVDALARAPMRWWAIPAGVVTVGAAVWLGRVMGGDDPCDALPSRSPWTDERRAALATAVEGLAVPFGATTWSSTAAVLDEVTAAIAEADRAACVASRDEPERAAASESCLTVVTDEVAQLLDDLAQGDASMVAAAPHRTAVIPDARGCADPRRARLLGSIDADAHARLQPAREALTLARRTHAELVFGAGTDFARRSTEAIAAATEAAVAAERESARALAATARTLEARLLLRRGDTAAAESAAARAVEHATAIDDPPLRAGALVVLTYAIGSVGDRTAEAEALAEQASAVLAANGDPPVLRGVLENNLGLAVSRAGGDSRDDAFAHHRRAVEVFTATLGEHHPDTIASHVNLGAALARRDRTREALAELEPVVPTALAVWGEHHPSSARLFGVIGNARLRAGDQDLAEQWLRRALTSSEASTPGDVEVANAQYNLAIALRRRLPELAMETALPEALRPVAREAVVLLRAATAIRERLEGRETGNLVTVLLALGEAELAAGDHAASEHDLRRALALAELHGDSALTFARMRLVLAMAIGPRDAEEARVLARAARRTYAEAKREAAMASCDRVLALLRPVGAAAR
jgi:tetratricopeptide (TPR) repeat protein/predicted Ser/Thr protein kinase